MGQTDLDSSLDDIIKSNKRRNSDSNRGRGRGRGRGGINRGGGGGGGGRGSKVISTRRPLHSSSSSSSMTRAPVRGGRERGRTNSSDRFDSRTNKAISKSKLALRGRIGRYNGSNSTSKNDDRRENTFTNSTRVEKREKIDPASIIITKSVGRPGGSKKTASIESPSITMQGGNSKKGYGNQQQMYPTGYGNHTQDDYHMDDQQQQQQLQHHQQQQQHMMRPTASGQIDTYAGNTIVLICNLDPAATAEDIGEACSQFGPIVSCDILLDQHGRPLSKAEIEFMYHTSAQDCVTKLDNQIADGRVLRAFLKSKATPPAVPRYSSRTVMSNPQGAEYNSPQLNVRYDQTRLPQENMQSRHYSHYPSQY